MKNKTSKITQEIAKRAREVPHGDLIVENGEITIPSVFMFKGGAEELFAFLHGCAVLNCAVRFENENLVSLPDGRKDWEGEEELANSMLLIIYATFAQDSVVSQQYARYLENRDKMEWPESAA